MLRIYWSEISGLSTETQGLPLSEYRLDKLDKISIPQKRKQSIAAELLLIHAVTTLYPEAKAPFEICCGEHGKPEFKDIPFYFSISHSGDYSACAVSDSPVGIDIECGLKCKPKIAERFFNAEEQKRMLSSENPDTEFACIWTGKESVLKFLGTGLSKGLLSVSIQDRESASVGPGNTCLKLFSYEKDDFMLTACSQLQHCDLQVEHVKLN